MATADYELSAQEQLLKNTQHHECYLHCTGGSLAAHKCFWVVVRYTWEDSTAVMESYQEDQQDTSFTITIEKNLKDKHVIKHILSATAYWTL